MNKSLSLLVVGAAAVSLMGFGCNPFQAAQDKISEKVGEKVAGGIVSGMTGGKVSMDGDGKTFEFKDNKTGNSMSIGENAKIPDDFPKEVPVYANAKVMSVSMQRTGDKEAALTLKSDDSVEKVTAWYADKFKAAGMTEDQNVTVGGSEVRAYSNATTNVTVTVFPDTDNKGAVVTLGWHVKPAETK